LLGGLVSALPLLEIKTRIGRRRGAARGGGHIHLGRAFYIGPNIPRDVNGLPLQTLQLPHCRAVLVQPPGAACGLARDCRHAVDRRAARQPCTDLLRDLFARQGLLPNIVLESDDASAPHSLVRAGLGLALLREDVAVPAAERGEVVIWPHTRVAAHAELHLPQDVGA
jgi:DNA-binding transcriptional LysR family regulator